MQSSFCINEGVYQADRMQSYLTKVRTRQRSSNTNKNCILSLLSVFLSKCLLAKYVAGHLALPMQAHSDGAWAAYFFAQCIMHYSVCTILIFRLVIQHKFFRLLSMVNIT